MEEGYIVCQRRNSEAAFRRFLVPARPGVRQVVRLALRHRVTTAIIVLMNALGLVTYLFSFAA